MMVCVLPLAMKIQFLLLVCASQGHADDATYFPCYRDMCRRQQQYCVQERQRCYLCADIIHLCNTSRLPRDCDSFCVRVQLDKALVKEADTSSQLTDTRQVLVGDHEKAKDVTQELKQVRLTIRDLEETNSLLLKQLNSSVRNPSCNEEMMTQGRYYRQGFIIACVVAGVMLLIVLLVISCCILRTRYKRNRASQSNPEACPVKPVFWSSAQDHNPLVRPGENTVSEECTLLKEGRRGTSSSDQHISHTFDHEHTGDPPEYSSCLDKKTFNITEVKIQDVENVRDMMY